MSGQDFDLDNEAKALVTFVMVSSMVAYSEDRARQALAAAFRAGAEQMRERAQAVIRPLADELGDQAMRAHEEGADVWEAIVVAKCGFADEIHNLVRALPVEEPRG